VVTTFSGDNVAGTTNIIPKMGLDRLLDGYRSIMKQIYSPPNFYQRVRYFLQELKSPDVTVPIDFQRLLGFFRSCVWLGIYGKERLHYWHLVFWTLHQKTQAAAFGYHLGGLRPSL
jgi:hypothetical protein